MHFELIPQQQMGCFLIHGVFSLLPQEEQDCVGADVVQDVHITVLDVSAKVDFYVMPFKGEGYPLILGRPWLMEVNADQKWGSGKLVLQKWGSDEDSSDESSYGDEESNTSEESSMEVMGLVFQQPQAKGSSTEVEVTAQEEPMLEERLRKMLATDLTKEEEEDYINMFKSDRALHCQRVEEGLQRIYQYGGQLNPDKCHVAEKEVVLLGHVILQEGIKVDPSRVQAILDLSPPNSAQKVITFVQKHMSISSKISKWVLELQEYEYTFIVEDNTRASLADFLTYKVKEKKITPKAQGKLDPSPQGELEDAHTLLFDGAYRRQRNKAADGFVIFNEEKKEVLKKGIQLHLAHSNNEAEYAILKAGLEEFKSMGIKRLMVKGNALLIVRQVQGTWACKNSKLLQWLHEVKLLMKALKLFKFNTSHAYTTKKLIIWQTLNLK
ncbi:hypothetical protein L7F22_051072 [Adiantum nelumboides]|nr:hypothetical protein [Adiantum nelumboides]